MNSEKIISIYKNSKFRIIIAILAIAIIFAGCSIFMSSRLREITTIKDAPQWSKEPVKINLKNYFVEPPFFEFAADKSNYLIAWLPPFNTSNPQDWYKALGKWVILDSKGVIIDTAKNEKTPIPQAFANIFPQVSWRSLRTKFIRTSKYWRFSDNWEYGFRSDDTDMELWKLSGTPIRIWAEKLPKVASGDFSLDLIEFISWKEKDCMLLGFFGDTAVIINREDGSIIGAFTYGPPNTEEREKAYQKKFNLPEEEGEFHATSFAWTPKKRWMACGEFSGRRVRVVSVDPPNGMLIELNSDDNPNRPWGGGWNVQRVNFSSSGKYMIVEYSFSGRLTSKYYKPTEIYDTQTWQKCWYENSYHVDEVTLSPDEQNIAFIRLNEKDDDKKWSERDKILEIGPFRPEVIK